MRDSIAGTRAPRRGARDRRRRRGARRALRGHRATHPRARRAWPLRRHALHDGAAGRLLPSGDAPPGRAHRRLGRALLLREEPPIEPGEGRLPRYTWFDAYAELREKLDALGRRLGGDVPRARRREPARRPRGRRALRRRLLRQEHAAHHAAPRILGRARHARHRRRDRAPATPLDLDCGSCTLCIDACPTGALDEPGVLDSTQVPLVLDAGAGADPGGVPRAARGAGVRLRHLPGRLPVEPRRSRSAARDEAARRSRAPRLARRLARGSRRRAARALRPPVRPAQRPPLPAPKRARRRSATPAVQSIVPHRAVPTRADDELLREHAEWALDRIAERTATSEPELRAALGARALDLA